MHYEYKILSMASELDDSYEELSAVLNKYGKKGWELVFILPRNSLGNTQYNLLGIKHSHFLVFKKILVQEAQK